MTATCPVDFDTVRLRSEIQPIYSRVASAPDGEFHFHRGAEYAATFLRYDRQALARIPAFAVESASGLPSGPRFAASRISATARA